MAESSINSSGASLAAVVLKGGSRLGAGWLLFVVAFHAVAQDLEPTTFWKRIQDKGIYERLWEATRLYENEDKMPPLATTASMAGLTLPGCGCISNSNNEWRRILHEQLKELPPSKTSQIDL
jgi:hypothetical protein